MSDKIKKVTIKIELDGSTEEETNLRNNTKLSKHAIALAGSLGLIQKLPEIVLLPVGLFAIADIEVVRAEPTQTTQAE